MYSTQHLKLIGIFFKQYDLLRRLRLFNTTKLVINLLTIKVLNVTFLIVNVI